MKRSVRIFAILFIVVFILSTVLPGEVLAAKPTRTPRPTRTPKPTPTPVPTPTPTPEPPLVLVPNWTVPDLPSNCELGRDSNGSETLICVPDVQIGLNLTAIIYAHGYVNPYFPDKQLPWDQLSTTDSSGNPLFLPTLVTDMGYYFAATSYRANGLVVQDAIQDLLLVRDMVKDKMYSIIKTFVLAGVSEGGLITALSMERYPSSYYAGLAMCGPIGDFRDQIDYWGDTRALYDAYYPASLPPDAITIANSTVESWYYDVDGYKTTTMNTALTNFDRTLELLTNANAPYGPLDDGDPATLDPTLEQAVSGTLLGLLDYNIFATENGKLVLGGNPFDNTTRDYPVSTLLGQDLDPLVARYVADPHAIAYIPLYDTTGVLTKPLVIMHTTGDPIVPFWHMDLYQAKVAARGYASNLSRFDVNRYGHCSFTQAEIMGAFDMLNYLATGAAPESHAYLLPESERGAYLRMLEEAGAIK